MRMRRKWKTNQFDREPDGWVIVTGKAESVNGIYNTKFEAVEAAKEMLAGQGGGAIRVHDPKASTKEKIKVKPAGNSSR